MNAAPAEAVARFRALDANVRRALLGLVVLAAWPVANSVLVNGAPPGVVFLGMVMGSLIGMSAVGVVLVYRAARIVNFAQSSLGSAAGVLAIMLFQQWHWNYFIAVPIGLIAAAGAGAIVDITVIRRFFWAPRLILTLATIGLAQILGGIELGIPVAFGGTIFGAGFKTPLSFSFTIDPIQFNGNHVMIMIVCPIAIGLLAWFLRGTDAGTGIRASAENAERAMLLGIPVRRLSTMVWMIAATLSALSFMLGAPILGRGLTAAGGPAVLLPALAAAVLARMDSLPKAFLGGIGLGVLQEVAKWNSPNRFSFTDVIFLAVVLIGLLLQRDRLSRADDAALSSWVGAKETPPVPTEMRGLPEVVWVRRGLVLAALGVALALPAFLSVSQINLLGTLPAIYAIVAISLVVLTGWAGQISLGQFAFAGVGAVAAANMLANEWDLFIAVPFAGVVAGIAAILVGLPALRIRGLFLAVTSLALAVPVASYFLNPSYFASVLPQQVNRVFLLERFDLQNEDTLYYFSLFILIGVVVLVRGLRPSRSGRALVAVRDNERAAQARGVPVMRVKLMAFGISGALAGVAGALHVMVVQGIGFGTYGTSQSFKAFSMVVIGGLTSVGGGLLGAITLALAEYIFSGGFQLVVTGAGVLFLLLFFPGGLGEISVRIRQRYLRLVANRRGLIVPSLVADRRVEEELGATVQALRIEDLFLDEDPRVMPERAEVDLRGNGSGKDNGAVKPGPLRRARAVGLPVWSDRKQRQPRVEPPRIEQPIAERTQRQPRVERTQRQPRVEPPRVERPRVVRREPAPVRVDRKRDEQVEEAEPTSEIDLMRSRLEELDRDAAPRRRPL